MTINIPAKFWTVSFSPRIMNEKRAVKIGMQFENIFGLVIPIFFTEKAKSINAPHEAKTDNSIIGIRSLKVNTVLSRLLKSKIRNTGRNRIVPIKF